jgi:hypothetical protein
MTSTSPIDRTPSAYGIPLLTKKLLREKYESAA